MRTQRAEVHEAGEGDGPDVLGVDYVATIELGKGPALGTMDERTQDQTKS